jgi:nitrogen-specific signal transduction histidine kinase
VIAAAAAILILMGVIAALIVGVVRLRRAERQIEAARRTAETANRAKSEFLARMSHELRTPLNAIIGFSTLLSEDDRRELPADVREYAGYILKGGRILLGLVNEVLDLARIEAGRNEIDIVMVPAAEVVEECVVMARSLAAHTDIVVEAPKLDRNLPLVLGDRARIGQVLLNLLSNAVKYNRPQGRVVLEVSQPSPEIVRFTVADTGKGIPADLREKVFEPFDRLGAENGTIEGTGIGLTIARRLLEMMDDSIDFESREGEGSRFWFDLPAGSAAPAAERKSTRTLLYIECNPAHADLAKAVVGQIAGWSLQVARSVDSAEWLSRREKPDAVLVAFDEGTGGEDDAVALLRGATGSPDLPVFALSIGGVNDAGRAIAAGYDACLGRPLDVETLQAHLSDSRITAARAARHRQPEHEKEKAPGPDGRRGFSVRRRRYLTTAISTRRLRDSAMPSLVGTAGRVSPCTTVPMADFFTPMPVSALTTVSTRLPASAMLYLAEPARSA